MDNFKFLPIINENNNDSALQYFSNTNEVEAFHSIITRNVNLEKLAKTLVTEDDEKSFKLLREVFAIADQYLNIKSVEEMLSVVLYVGINIKEFMSAAIRINERKSGKNKEIPDFIKDLIEKISKGRGHVEVFPINGNSEFPESNNSNYTYKLDSRLFIEDLGGDNFKSVTNNIENVINEIIKKESFSSVSSKRIFSKGTDDVVCEIIPKYKNEKCIDAQFEIIND